MFVSKVGIGVEPRSSIFFIKMCNGAFIWLHKVDFRLVIRRFMSIYAEQHIPWISFMFPSYNVASVICNWLMEVYFNLTHFQKNYPVFFGSKENENLSRGKFLIIFMSIGYVWFKHFLV